MVQSRDANQGEGTVMETKRARQGTRWQTLGGQEAKLDMAASSPGRRSMESRRGGGRVRMREARGGRPCAGDGNTENPADKHIDAC